jgi:hypothetical protein
MLLTPLDVIYVAFRRSKNTLDICIENTQVTAVRLEEKVLLRYASIFGEAARLGIQWHSANYGANQ